MMIKEPAEPAVQDETAEPELTQRPVEFARAGLFDVRKRIEAYVRHDPLRALGVALGTGILIGWWARRR